MAGLRAFLPMQIFLTSDKLGVREGSREIVTRKQLTESSLIATSEQTIPIHTKHDALLCDNL